MAKWLLTLFVVVAILAIATPFYYKRFRKLPGDFRIPVRGRVYYFPFASVLIASLLAWAVARLL
jgi:hypothetical protein